MTPLLFPSIFFTLFAFSELPLALRTKKSASPFAWCVSLTNALAYYAKEGSVMNVPILFQALKIFLSGETTKMANCSISGATTFSIMTLSIMTLSIMTLSIMTLSIKTLSIMTLRITTLSITTLSITKRKCDTEHNNA
jgi:hypothetical protein